MSSLLLMIRNGNTMDKATENMRRQEQQISAANDIVRLTIDPEKSEYTVDTYEGVETMYFECENEEDARALYRCLLKTTLTMAHCCARVVHPEKGEEKE